MQVQEIIPIKNKDLPAEAMLNVFRDKAYSSHAVDKNSRWMDINGKNFAARYKYAMSPTAGDLIGYWYFENLEGNKILKISLALEDPEKILVQNPHSMETEIQIKVYPKSQAVVWFEYFPDSKLTYKPKVVIQENNEKISQTLKIESEIQEKLFEGQPVEIFEYLWNDETKTIFAFENLTSHLVLEQYVQWNLVGSSIVGESGNGLNLVLGPGQVRVVEILRKENFALHLGKVAHGVTDEDSGDSGVTRPRATYSTLCVGWPCKIQKSEYRVRRV